MSFSILKKSTRRTIGVVSALVVVSIIIYGFLSTYQQTKNKSVAKVNLVQAAIYGSDRTEVIPLLYEAVAGEECIKQLTFAVAASSAATSSLAATHSSIANHSMAAVASGPAQSFQSSSAMELPEAPLVNASSPKCLAQTPAPDGYQKLGAESAVTLALNLAATGRIERGEVEKSSGFPDLDAAALQQVTQTWQFEPCKKADKAVACRQYIRFRWQLK